MSVAPEGARAALCVPKACATDTQGTAYTSHGRWPGEGAEVLAGAMNSSVARRHGTSALPPGSVSLSSVYPSLYV